MNETNKIAPRKNRPGAGRKVGSGKFREATSVLRIPVSQEPVIKRFLGGISAKKTSN